MNIISWFIEFVLHLDKHILEIVTNYGTWSYAVLFAIIFAETGLVVTPFLPGDSLLFATGAVAALGGLNIWILFILLSIAAIIGDTVNYWLGSYLGPKIFKKDARILKKEYLDRTNEFYKKHGGKTIILARFVPIVRTFAPFVAGIGKMDYWKFLVYNIVGGIAWVGIFLFGGYFFGNIPWVKENFGLSIILVIIISFIPIIYEVISHRRKQKKQAKH